MKKKPIIGITVDVVKNSEKYKYSPSPWHALRKCYSNCVAQAGGIPILIPCVPEEVGGIIQLIDGLIISGGDHDISPKFYNQELRSNKVKLNEERTNFEAALTQAALTQNLPILGICGGMQLINVLLGGNLIQHIPDYIVSEIDHLPAGLKNVPAHSINIKSDTILFKLASNQTSVMVNSSHHQAVDRLGTNLIAAAIAPDGIIEALEAVNHEFIVGVEWHPEYLNSELDFNLFKGLVTAAKNIKHHK